MPYQAELGQFTTRQLLSEVAQRLQAKSPLLQQLAEGGTTPSRIQEAVAEAFQISVKEMNSEKREERQAIPRMVSMVLCYHLTPASLAGVALMHGRTDHATTAHARRRVPQLLRQPGIASRYDQAIAALEGKTKPKQEEVAA